MCLEHGLVFFSGCQSDLVVAGAEVQFGEPGRAVKFVQEFFDDRYRVFGDQCEGVEVRVIDAQAPCPIFFLDQNDR